MSANDRSSSAVDDDINAASIISFVMSLGCDWKQHGCVLLFYV